MRKRCSLFLTAAGFLLLCGAVLSAAVKSAGKDVIGGAGFSSFVFVFFREAHGLHAWLALLGLLLAVGGLACGRKRGGDPKPSSKRLCSRMLKAALLAVLMLCACAGAERSFPFAYAGNYAKPVKQALSAEDQSLVNSCYRELCRRYPHFGAIPREMLLESVNRGRDGAVVAVRFTFCLGGIQTDCECTYFPASLHSGSRWELREDEFRKYYQSGLTEAEMSRIKAELTGQIRAQIESYHLALQEPLEDEIHLYWSADPDGRLCAMAECIAGVTPQTTREFGCGDHAHLFGKVPID